MKSGFTDNEPKADSKGISPIHVWTTSKGEEKKLWLAFISVFILSCFLFSSAANKIRLPRKSMTILRSSCFARKNKNSFILSLLKRLICEGPSWNVRTKSPKTPKSSLLLLRFFAKEIVILFPFRFVSHFFLFSAARGAAKLIPWTNRLQRDNSFILAYSRLSFLSLVYFDKRASFSGKVAKWGEFALEKVQRRWQRLYNYAKRCIFRHQ